MRAGVLSNASISTLLFFVFSTAILVCAPVVSHRGAGWECFVRTARAETAGPNVVSAAPPKPSVPIQTVRILKTFPHDPEAFTEGLIFLDGFFYESTGMNGKSSLRKVEIKTGRVTKQFDLQSQYFGEGLAEWNGALIQLTWRSGKGFIYNRDSFAVENTFSYSMEGWGLTRDDKNLVMSNGSNRLIFLDPQTFATERVLEVACQGKPIRLLNELEFVKGEILANIWQKDFVARISPKTGQVISFIDMSALRKELPPGQRIDVLNGIAYDGEKDRLYVTGKFWPKVFQIEIVDRSE